MKKSGAVALSLIVLALGGYGWYANQPDKPKAAPSAGMPVPVTIAQAQLGDIPVLLEMVGRAEAYESVTLKSRLDGQVASVAYTEGQHVKAGQLLLQLDPADYQARVLQAEANVARDEVQLAKAKADFERYTSLKARGFISDEKLNEVRTAEAAATATVKADRAALELARLQLSYTSIKAPFAGIVGARLVFPGSAVKINDTALAVVNRVSPLYVSFALPEKHLATVRQAMSKGALKVNVSLPGKKDEWITGSARFIDNAVDASTGTIQMKAILENKDERLVPGQFLNVSLALEKIQGAVLIPNEAVQQGQNGNFLYVVKADNTVEPRQIDVSTSVKGQSAIAKGLAAGETVVLDGQLRLAPGAKISTKTATKEAPDKAATAPVAAKSESSK